MRNLECLGAGIIWRILHSPVECLGWDDLKLCSAGAVAWKPGLSMWLGLPHNVVIGVLRRSVEREQVFLKEPRWKLEGFF